MPSGPRTPPGLPHPPVFAVLLAASATGATCTTESKPPAPTRIEVPSGPAATPTPAPLTELEGVELRRVPPQSRAEAAQLLQETFCYCGCARTVASCLANTDTCPCVRCSERVAEFVVQAFESGASGAQVESLVVRAFSESYNARPETFNLRDQAIKGNPDAPYTLVEFADFNCGHCKEAFHQIKAFLEENPDVKVAFFFFPLPFMGESSLMAAQAAEAARRQGKFWEMAETLFAHQQQFERDKLVGYAKQLGLDIPQFEQALDSSDVAAAVLADRDLGKQVGVEGTPALFLDGRPTGLSYDAESLAFRLQMEKDRSDCR